MKILVVDDNKINRQFIYYSLKSYFEIEMAGNGLEAVDRLARENFDLVLMDLSMPVMDGAEATEMIRQSKNIHIANIPIIFVTTSDFEHDKIRCLDKGANDYLVKPLDSKILLEKINFYLQKNTVG